MQLPRQLIGGVEAITPAANINIKLETNAFKNGSSYKSDLGPIGRNNSFQGFVWLESSTLKKGG